MIECRSWENGRGYGEASLDEIGLTAVATTEAKALRLLRRELNELYAEGKAAICGRMAEVVKCEVMSDE